MLYDAVRVINLILGNIDWQKIFIIVHILERSKTNKILPTIMDNANGDKEITSLLVNKYETLYLRMIMR